MHISPSHSTKGSCCLVVCGNRVTIAHLNWNVGPRLSYTVNLSIPPESKRLVISEDDSPKYLR